MCLSAMHLKFPVAAELVATSYSLPAGNREKKATTHVFQKKKKGKKIRKKGGNHPKRRCLLVPPAELVVFGRVPQQSSRVLWGAQSL